MVVEIPQNTRAKMEIDTKNLTASPIKHDIIKSSGGQVRFYKHPKVPFFNYGIFPQTLEVDGDPLDAIDVTGKLIIPYRFPQN